MGSISGSSARAAGYRPPILGMPPQQNEQVDEEAGVAGEEHHQQMVMRNPDGSMVMLLSPNNPYHKAQLEHDGAAAPPQEGIETPPVIHPAILEQFHGPLQLERMARVVRLLALFDMAFSLLHAMADLWPAAVAASVMSYSGCARPPRSRPPPRPPSALPLPPPDPALPLPHSTAGPSPNPNPNATP